MIRQRYTIRYLNLAPLAKFGFVLGGAAMFLPGLICAGLTAEVIALLRQFLTTLQTSSNEDFGFQVMELDVVQLLGLEVVQQLIIQLDDQSLLLALFIILSSMMGGGLLIGLTVMLTGWLYNLLAAITGGVEVEALVSDVAVESVEPTPQI